MPTHQLVCGKFVGPVNIISLEGFSPGKKSGTVAQHIDGFSEIEVHFFSFAIIASIVFNVSLGDGEISISV